jgi:hypothetical protein
MQGKEKGTSIPHGLKGMIFPLIFPYVRKILPKFVFAKQRKERFSFPDSSNS